MKIVEKIIGFLFIQSMKPALNKAARELEDDPEFQASIEGMKYHREQLDKLLINWCKYHPEEYECKKRAKK